MVLFHCVLAKNMGKKLHECDLLYLRDDDSPGSLEELLISQRGILGFVMCRESVMLQEEQGVQGRQAGLLVSSYITGDKILRKLVLINITSLAVGWKSWAKCVGLEETS